MKILLLMTFLVPTLVYSQSYGNGGGGIPGERAALKRKEKIKKCKKVSENLIISFLDKKDDFRLGDIKNVKEVRELLVLEYWKIVMQVPKAMPNLSLEQIKKCELDIESDPARYKKMQFKYESILIDLEKYKDNKCRKYNRFNKLFKDIDIDNAIDLLKSLKDGKHFKKHEIDRI